MDWDGSGNFTTELVALELCRHDPRKSTVNNYYEDLLHWIYQLFWNIFVSPYRWYAFTKNIPQKIDIFNILGLLITILTAFSRFNSVSNLILFSNVNLAIIPHTKNFEFYQTFVRFALELRAYRNYSKINVRLILDD